MEMPAQTRKIHVFCRAYMSLTLEILTSDMNDHSVGWFALFSQGVLIRILNKDFSPQQRIPT